MGARTVKQKGVHPARKAAGAGDLLHMAAEVPGVAGWIDGLSSSAVPLLSSVPVSALPFVCASAAVVSGRRIFFVCGSVRHQERLHAELLNWLPAAHLLSPVELPAVDGAIADPDLLAERYDLLDRLAREAKGGPPVVLLAASLEEEAPTAASLQMLTRKVARGHELALEAFAADLAAHGYVRVPQVTARGEFSVRGGIVDLFSWQQAVPVRIEFFGNRVESIRDFDIDSQKSTGHTGSCAILFGQPSGNFCRVRDYLQSEDLLIAVDCDEEGAHGKIRTGGEGDSGFSEADMGSLQAGDFVIESASRRRLLMQLEEWRVAQWTVVVFCATEGDAGRLQEILCDAGTDAGAFLFLEGASNGGFLVPSLRLAVLSDALIFGRHRTVSLRKLERRRAAVVAARAQMDFSELEDDALVVHFEHGIGRYCGLTKIPSGAEGEQEVLEIEFAGGAKLFVPLEHAHLVARYVGVGRRNPPLSKLGDAKWARAKKNAERAVYDYASSLLKLAAERETSRGFAFDPDTKWQEEFEDAFPFEETHDQLRAIVESKQDMESARPMDRLICGDVGFGKTEVAIRAAFKAVMSGKQVAVLVPTTVLAQQHEENFRERMSEFPVTIRGLSRFVKPAEQRRIIGGLRDGSVDIVVGTHRLISQDIAFKNLGLVVIDEEQRFGVLHKERFKSMFRLVDVLTLSATPIPRTLYLSLMGARDMSVIETPPANRLPVETLICPYDERVIRQAIERELERGGQVYFLHNRVGTIDTVAGRIRHLVPGAKVEIGHGRMDETELEDVMHRFVRAETDVLVSTTIIESGLDIPNANTIIIDRADRFGLADLYQLRGRVGRAQNKAYAFLMLPRDFLSAGEARKRIEVIRQYSSLGAGFKIAMRDLEIRGAGNILGTAQSGHIVAVGFDLYCQLLKQAVEKLRSGRISPRLSVGVAIDFVGTSEGSTATHSLAPAFLPASYIEDASQRVRAYRDLAEASDADGIRALESGWRDRFGPLPDGACHLLEIARIKVAAAAAGVASVECREGKVMLRRGGEFVTVGGKFPRLAATGTAARLSEVRSLLESLRP